MRVKKINDFYHALIEYGKNGYIAHNEWQIVNLLNVN